MRWTVALTGMLWGCAPALGPRTADVLPPGQPGGGLTMVPWAHTHGSVPLTQGAQPLQDFKGNAAFRMEREVSIAAAIFYMYSWNTDFTLRVGLPARLELGASFGWGRTGLEFRHGLLDEDRGAPLSLAPAAHGAVNVFSRRAPFGRVGFDASRRLGDVQRLRWITVLGGLHVSRGERTANLLLGKAKGRPIQCTEGWPGTPCATANPRTRAWVDYRSTTTALSIPLGVAHQDVTTRGRLRTVTVGAVAHLPLAGRTTRPRCYGCGPGLEVGPVTEGPGVHLTVGFDIGRLDGPNVDLQQSQDPSP